MVATAEDLAKKNQEIQKILGSTEINQADPNAKQRVSSRNRVLDRNTAVPSEQPTSSLSEIINDVTSDKEKKEELINLSKLENVPDCCNPDKIREQLALHLKNGTIPAEKIEFIKILINDPERLQALINSETSETLKKIFETGDISPITLKAEKFASEDVTTLVVSKVSDSPIIEINPKINTSATLQDSSITSTDQQSPPSIALAEKPQTDASNSSSNNFESYKQTSDVINYETNFQISSNIQSNDISESDYIRINKDLTQPGTYNSTETKDYKQNLQNNVEDNSPYSEQAKQDYEHRVVNFNNELSANRLDKSEVTTQGISRPFNTTAGIKDSTISSDTRIENNQATQRQAKELPPIQHHVKDHPHTKLQQKLERIRLANSSVVERKIPLKDLLISSKTLTTNVIQAFKTNTKISALLPESQKQYVIQNIQNTLSKLPNIINQAVATQLSLKIISKELVTYLKPEITKSIIQELAKKLEVVAQPSTASKSQIKIETSLTKTNNISTTQNSNLETRIRISIVNNITPKEIQKLALLLTTDKLLIQKYSPQILRKLSDKLEQILRIIGDKDRNLSIKDKKLLNITLKELQEVLGKDAEKILKSLRSELQLKQDNRQDTIRIDKKEVHIQMENLRLTVPRFESLPLQLQNLIAMYLMQQLAQYRSAQDLYEMIKEINAEWAEMLKELDLERLLNAGVEFSSNETKNKKRKKVRTSRGPSIDIESSRFKNQSKGNSPSDGMTSGSKLSAKLETTKISQKADTSGPSADLIIARTKSDDKKKLTHN
jgi:hypothetical protein